MDRAAARHPDVVYHPMLIDAAYAGLMTEQWERSVVIPTLNRDGDCLSDLVLAMFGSIAGAESVLLALDDRLNPTTAMAEAPHGTAPSLEGKNVANPLAMILAAAALLSQTEEGTAAGRAIRESALEAVAQGVKTADLGGHSTTSEFTDDVVGRTRTKLEVWSTL
jgi:isocitrate/isopropylmalate dehydrogenase